MISTLRLPGILNYGVAGTLIVRQSGILLQHMGNTSISRKWNSRLNLNYNGYAISGIIKENVTVVKTGNVPLKKIGGMDAGMYPALLDEVMI